MVFNKRVLFRIKLLEQDDFSLPVDVEQPILSKFTWQGEGQDSRPARD